MREITRRIRSRGCPGAVAGRRSGAGEDPLGRLRSAAQARAAAESQLGTVGSGNHYVNLMEDEEGRIWSACTSGRVASATGPRPDPRAAEGLRFGDRAHEGEMDSPLVLFEIESESARRMSRR